MHRKALQAAIAPAGLVIEKVELSGGELLITGRSRAEFSCCEELPAWLDQAQATPRRGYARELTVHGPLRPALPICAVERTLGYSD